MDATPSYLTVNQLIIPLFIAGVMFGCIILPVIIEKIRYRFSDNAEKMEKRLQKEVEAKRKAIRQTDEFKKRLECILDLIKEAKQEDEEKSSIRVTRIPGCPTDCEVSRALKEKGFRLEECYDKNLMEVYL